MIEKINEEVGIVTIYDPIRQTTLPYRLRWKGRYYVFEKVDLCHPVWEGKTLHHIYSLSDGTTYFRLNFNTRSLHWILEETSDGLPN